MDADRKKEEVITEEEAKVIFYMTLVEKLNQKADILPKPDGSNKVDFSNYSKAYQNFAQKNVSKLEGFDTAVIVNDTYNEKLKKLIGDKK